MKNYVKPEMTVLLFSTEDIITASSTAPNTLVDGGGNGQPVSESYGSMFGGN